MNKFFLSYGDFNILNLGSNLKFVVPFITDIEISPVIPKGTLTMIKVS
jgi:hypothetical protein